MKIRPLLPPGLDYTLRSLRTQDGILRGAIFSKDKKYRYALWRKWGKGNNLVGFIGLNPSTATHEKDDATIRRLTAFAKAWGYDGFIICNLFAFRSRDPNALYLQAENAVGMWNYTIAKALLVTTAIRVAMWGAHGSYLAQSSVWKQRYPDLQCFGTTKDGEPKHPLYLPSNTQLIAFK